MTNYFRLTCPQRLGYGLNLEFVGKIGLLGFSCLLDFYV